MNLPQRAPGGILAVATAALAVFPATIQETMVAISGSETGWQNEPGDPLSIYPDGGTSERPYSCGGYTSFSPWQVNLPWNHSLIEQLSSVPMQDACGQAAWLMSDIEHGARAAFAVYKSAGFAAWTTYRTGAYLPHMGDAQQALTEARARLKKPGPVPRPAPSMPILIPGDEGLSVRVLEILLDRAGVAKVAPDGTYSDEIEAAVVRAKKLAKLPENGVVGGGLWLWLTGGK